MNIYIPSEYYGLSFCLYDVYGRIIREFVVDKQVYSIDLSNLSDGVYVLRGDAMNMQAKIVLLKK